MFNYCVHGIDIRSDIDLELESSNAHSLQTDHKIHLEYRLVDAIPEPRTQPLWQSEYSLDTGEAEASIWQESQNLLLQIPAAGRFLLSKNTVTIQLSDDDHPIPALIGRVLALFFELQAIPVLHGICMTKNKKTIALLGSSGVGKSSLSLALQRLGYQYITEDLIPLSNDEFVILPGIPQCRIWPDIGEKFIKNYPTYPRVHPLGEKRKIPLNDSSPLGCVESAKRLNRIILLDRCRPDKQSHPQLGFTGAADALLEITAQSYASDLCEVLQLQPHRMKIFAKLAESLPIQWFRFPSGYEQLMTCANYLDDAVQNTNETWKQRNPSN